MFHPAILILVWSAFVFWLQWQSWMLIIPSMLLVCGLALVMARARLLLLLRRTRWLLLALLGLYCFSTPGEYLPGWAGVLGLTREGLLHGVEQIGRLLALLASLAVLHQRLGTDGLLAGLYHLLPPVSWRERTLVRLMLIIENFENKEKVDWRSWIDPLAPCPDTGGSMRLPLTRLRYRDWAIILLSVPALLFWIFVQ